MFHHAILFVGERTVGLKAAYDAIGIQPAESADHPDIQILAYERFGIDEARSLKQTAYSLPVKAPVRSFIIAVGAMTGEAQNALLKLLEEPPSTSRFFIIIEREDTLLPTLRSRMHAIALAFEGHESARSLAERFLGQSYADRLAEIAVRTKDKDDVWMRDIMRGLEEVIYDGTAPHRLSALSEIVRVRSYLDARGASPKMLLEHLALSLA